MGEAAIIAALSTAVSTAQGIAQQRAQQRAQNRAAEAQIQEANLRRQQQEKQAREQAKQSQASARASFGARGVSSTGGSAGALVEGIGLRTEKDIAENRQLDDLSIANLRASQRDQEKLSLLKTRNSIMNSIVDTGGQAMTSYLKSKGGG